MTAGKASYWAGLNSLRAGPTQPNITFAWRKKSIKQLTKNGELAKMGLRQFLVLEGITRSLQSRERRFDSDPSLHLFIQSIDDVR
jgi:hypothetical protein